MTGHPPLPRFAFRPAMPGLWDMVKFAVRDPARLIPAVILDQPAVQLPGLGAPLVISDPKLARLVLNDRDGMFMRDKMLRRLFRRAWGNGIAGAEGEAWKNQRRAAAPAFRPQTVADHSPAFAAAAGKAAAEWPVGTAVELTSQSAPIIADIVFATLVDSAEAFDGKAVAADIPAYIERIANFRNIDLLPLPETVHDRISGLARDPAVQRITALARRVAGTPDLAGQRTGLISLLRGIGSVEDNLRGLFPAAMDTTVSATSWTLYMLSRLGHWQKIVADEARSCKGDYRADRLEQTQRVVMEVLRLFPPAPLIIRSTAVAGTLGGFHLRKGQPVLICTYAMHRHRLYWDQPDVFDPGRFSNGHDALAAWMPFGSGPRVCIAAQFALAEITTVVARLLADLRLEPSAPDADVTLRVTTRSATGLHVIAHRRR